MKEGIRSALSTFVYMAIGVGLMTFVVYLIPVVRDYVHVAIGVGTCYAIYVSVTAYRKTRSDA
jgi:hypothetical protein